MDAKDKEILKLKRRIAKLEEEIEFLTSPLYKYQLFEEIQGYYSILLNPPLKEFKTTKNQSVSIFNIDINDVICLKAEGKYKDVYFKNKQISIDGIRIESDKLTFLGSFEEFCNQYDHTKIHLCLVSKSYVVNVLYYELDGNKLILNKDIKPSDLYNEITISPNNIQTFIERKKTLETLISFQKNRFHSK